MERVASGVPVGAANLQDIYPMAPLQEGILFHHLLGGEGDPYLLATLHSFDSRERLDGYLKAMQAGIGRHDILRTAGVWEELCQPGEGGWGNAPGPGEKPGLDAADGGPGEEFVCGLNPRRV